MRCLALVKSARCGGHILIIWFLGLGNEEGSDLSSKRETDPLWAPGSQVAFPDGFPCLVTTQVGDIL